MINDYASLQATIADYLGRSDLTTQIQTFIAQGEARIYRTLRVMDMEEALNLTIDGTTGTVALPSDYLALQEAYVQTGGELIRLERADPWWIRSRYPTQSAQSTPIYIARENQTFIFAPFPDQAYPIVGTYYGRLPGLSTANPSNWLTAKNPDLIMAAAMLEAATFLVDADGVQYWTQRLGEVITAVQSADTGERFSGSPIVMRAV